MNLTFDDSLYPKRKLSEHLLSNRQERHWLVWIHRNESIVRHRYQLQLQHLLVRTDCRSILVSVLDTSISLKNVTSIQSNQISFSFKQYLLLFSTRFLALLLSSYSQIYFVQSQWKPRTWSMRKRAIEYVRNIGYRGCR